MSNLLDMDDNFPQNPFNENTIDDSFPQENLPVNTREEFGSFETPQPQFNPTTSLQSFGDSIISTETTSIPFGSSSTPTGLQSILTGDTLFAVPKPTENDEKLRLWRTNHNQALVKKAEESRIKTEEQRKRAQSELEEFYQRRDEQIKNKTKENNESEKDFIHKREETSNYDNKWERVRHLIDIKGIEKSTESKDTSRLRSVLIKMWNKK